MSVHGIAAEGFDKEAKTYAASRPSYPPDAVAWIAEELRLGPGVRCLDLAAGTGIFTRLLERTQAHIIAAEPVAGMRRELVASQPDLACVSCVAEKLPFVPASLDAISVAQAFHWFDADRAMNEFYRVLQPGGSVAMLWNARLRHVDWVDQVWGVMDRVEKHAPWRNHDHVATGDTNAFREDDLANQPGFGNLRTAQFVHEQLTTPQGVVARVKGVSHVAVLAAVEQAAVLDEVRHILATHPDTNGREHLAIPYRVDCYALTRKPGSRT